MSDSSVKKRSCNWTEREKIILVEEIVKREDVLFGKFKPGLTSKNKEAAWEDVLQCVNSISQDLKTVDQIKKQYSNIKQRTKESIDHARKTGGGPKMPNPPSSQQILLDRMGDRPQVVGLPLNLDTEGLDTIISGPSTATNQGPLSVPSSPDHSSPIHKKSKGKSRKRHYSDSLEEYEKENLRLENNKLKLEAEKLKIETEKLKLECELIKMKKSFYEIQYERALIEINTSTCISDS